MSAKRLRLSAVLAVLAGAPLPAAAQSASIEVDVLVCAATISAVARLDCYDDLARRLGGVIPGPLDAPAGAGVAAPPPVLPEAPPAPVVIATFSGEGGQNTPAFTVGAPWEVRWSSTGMLDLYLHDADGRILRNVVTQWQAGDGVSPQSEGGTFYFDVNLGDRWTIEVVGPPPAAVPVPAATVE